VCTLALHAGISGSPLFFFTRLEVMPSLSPRLLLLTTPVVRKASVIPQFRVPTMVYLFVLSGGPQYLSIYGSGFVFFFFFPDGVSFSR